MIDSLPSDISIHSDGERLILPPDLDANEIASIIEHKPRILQTLRSSQMNAAGFYIALPGSLRRKLQVAPWVALKLETTAPTRFSAPDRLSPGTRIGSQTWMAYRATNPGVSVNSSPRIRVLSVYTDQLGACAWDLDALAPEDRQQLLSEVVCNKIVIAHNAGFDLSWLFIETVARPAFVLDSMLLTRHLRPGALLRPFGTAVVGDEDAKKRAKALIQRDRGEPSTSPEWIAVSLNLQAPDTGYQPHSNWCVSTLSSQHHVYATAGVSLPMHIVRFLLPGMAVQEMPSVIESKYPWYTPYVTATARLAEAHVRGVPFDMEAAERLRAEYLTEIVRAADELVQTPEFGPLYKQLVSPQTGETAELAMALAKYAMANGVSLPQTETGSFNTTQQAGSESGADKLPAWDSFQTIKSNKVGQRTLERYRQAASPDGRMHSLVTFTAATGRNTSCEPTLQNVPRDSRFRALIKARPGYLILAADYSAIEMRIAAVLAERAVFDLRQRVEKTEDDGWFMDRVKAGVREFQVLHCPPEPNSWTLDWLNVAIPAVAQTVLRRDVQMMMSIFRRGLDPHLATALDMGNRRGKIESDHNPLDWLASQDKQTQQELKTQLQDERQRAKPANFGLLYGMGADRLHQYGISNYGLSWTPKEAARARLSWFALYPEFRLWHFWTKYLQSRKVPVGKCAIWNSDERKFVTPQYVQRLYETNTLSGRPFVILNNFRQALNYQDQGTGADILAGAIASLPENIAQMLLIPIHDELVFEVPENEIDEVRRMVVVTMTRAANKVLGDEIPIDLESAIGKTWQKS
jgi:DNA polymerase family A